MSYEIPTELGTPGCGTPRKQYVSVLRDIGLPTSRREDWRYTKLRGFDLSRFGQSNEVGSIDRTTLAQHVCRETAGQIVIVDGVFQPQLSVLPAQPGVRAEHASGEALQLPPLPSGELQSAPFLAVNAALAPHLTRVTVAPKTRVEGPLELVWVSTSSGGTYGMHPLVQIQVGKHAEVTVVERFIGLGTHETLTNMRLDINVDDGAHVQHAKIQKEGAAAWHFATTIFHLGADTSARSNIVSLGAKTARNAIHVHFEKPGSEVWLDGLFVGQGQQSLDHYTVIDHKAPHCTSHELYKGVLQGQAIGSFLGRILMSEGAVKSATDQLCRALLLSQDAKANVKPQLEIDNDDVTASHGAAIGNLDADAMFYLQARGISVLEAQSLLIEAFTREVLQKLPCNLEEPILETVLARLA